MSINAGDSFLAPWPDGDINHLHFVISDPALDRDRVVLVPMMTWDDLDCLDILEGQNLVESTS